MTEDIRTMRFSRQKIRKILLILTFILTPITIFYVSPIVIIMGAEEGIATGSMLLFILLVVLSLFVGRLWCGWLCPMGAWQELCSPLMKESFKGTWINRIKYGVAFLWIGFIAFLLYTAGGIRYVDPFYGTTGGISVSSPEILMIVCIIFAIIFVVAYLTGRRGFCHVLCPIGVLMIVGRKISPYARLPALRLHANPERCIDCMQCQKQCPMGLDVHEMVKADKMENTDCILCASCADICPENVIRYEITR